MGNPERHPAAHYREAHALAAWLASAEAQTLIRDFRGPGQARFVPDLLP